MSGGSMCLACGEPLLAYSADAGNYLGCPKCLWMGEPDGRLASTETSDVLDHLPEDPTPGWLVGDLDFPPSD